MSKSTELEAQLLHISLAEHWADRRLVALRHIPIMRVAQRLNLPLERIGRGRYLVAPRLKKTNLIIDTKTNSWCFKTAIGPDDMISRSVIEFYMTVMETDLEKSIAVLGAAFPKYNA